MRRLALSLLSAPLCSARFDLPALLRRQRAPAHRSPPPPPALPPSNTSYWEHTAEAALVAAQRCTPGCTVHGNCDTSTGTCDCPLGRGGPSCEELTLPGCQLAPSFVTPCGRFPTSCLCLEQCAAALGTSLGYFYRASCFPASPGSLADLPAYFGGPQRAALRHGSRDAVADPWEVAAPGSCRGGCHYGYCRAKASCVCLPGWTGARCDEPEPQPCLNGCSARGNCTAGWCHCQPGFYGDECALSVDANGHPRLFSAVPAPQRPTVYIHHLPGRFSGWHWGTHADRPVSEMLLEQLASSPHRTTDLAGADYAFVPLALRKLQVAHLDVLAAYASACLAHVAALQPGAWRGGARHWLVVVTDRGPDEIWRPGDGPGLPTAFANITLLTHAGAPQGDKGTPLFRRGRDVLLPPLQNFATGFPVGPGAPAVRPGQGGVRTNLLFWSGAIRRDASADGPGTRNMRLRLHALFANTSGVVMHDTRTQGPLRGDYAQLFRTSRFCLAPAGKGGGWGRRATLAALYGCVPVRVQDGTAEALDDLLDWPSFSVTVPERKAEQLVAVLEAIGPAQLAAMQAQLECAWPRWLYSGLAGAVAAEDGSDDALASLLLLLARRDQGLPPAAPCALRTRPGCTLPRVGLLDRHAPAPWPAGGAACFNNSARPCVLPRAGCKAGHA